MSEMSEMSYGESRMDSQIYEHLKKKSKEQLIDELAVLTEKVSVGDGDPELIDMYLDVLDELDPLPFEIDADEAYEHFVDRHAVLLETSSEKNVEPSASNREQIPVTQKHFRRAFKKFVSAAAIVAVLFGSMVTAQAFGFDIFGAIAKWTENTFGLRSESIPYAEITKSPLEEGEMAEYESLEAAVAAFGVTESVIPQRLPSRFTLNRVSAHYHSGGIFICADYICEDGFFQIRYNNVTNKDFDSLEKQEGNESIYKCGELQHYLFTDVNRMVAFWQNGVLECCMMGSVSETEMKEIIDSIYKELE